MEKYELIMTTAKEISLKHGFAMSALNSFDDLEPRLKHFDKSFKSIVKTVSEAYESIKISH
jgi:hypothetical protein